MRRQTAILLAAAGGGVLVLLAFLGVAYFVYNDYQDRRAKIAYSEYEREWDRVHAAISLKRSREEDLEFLSGGKPFGHPFNVSGLSKPELQAEIDSLGQEIDELSRHLDEVQKRWNSRWIQLGYKR